MFDLRNTSCSLYGYYYSAWMVLLKWLFECDKSYDILLHHLIIFELLF